MAEISDSFGGTGVLDNHLSDQGKPWVAHSGSLSLDGSGLTTDAFGDGIYYLDDSNWGSASPHRIDLTLSLPTIPTPDEALDIWLFAFGDPVNDSTSQNYLGFDLQYRHGAGWSYLIQSIQASGVDLPGNFALGALAGPPAVISIDPVTGKFLADNVVIGGPLTAPPTFGAVSRPGLELSFVTGVNVHATLVNAAAAAAGASNNGGGGLPINMMAIQFPPGVKVTHRELQRSKPLVRRGGR